MKYIVLKVEHGGVVREVPIIFPEFLVHANVSAALLEHCSELKDGTPIAAGEFSSLDIDADCHGKSISLKVESRRLVDSQLINMYDYNHGVV